MSHWFRVQSNVGSNRKVQVFAATAGLSTVEAVGSLVLLWAAVRTDAPDGDCSGWSPAEFAAAMCLPLETGEKIVSSLTSARLLDENRRIWGWNDHNGQFLKDAERKRKERASKDVHGRPPLARAGGQDMTGEDVEPRDSASVEVDLENHSALPLLLSENDKKLGAIAPLFPVTDEQDAESAKQALKELTKALAGSKAPAKKKPPTYLRDELMAQVKELPDATQRTAFALLARVVAGGTRESVALAVVRHWIENRSRIDNPFAYYAKGSDGLLFVERRMRLTEDQAAHDADKKAHKEALQ